MEIKREECEYISKMERKIAGKLESIEIVAIKIDAINFIGVYQLDNEDRFLYATDDDGNPKRKSCFKLID